jgi:hypothetical protein
VGDCRLIDKARANQRLACMNPSRRDPSAGDRSYRFQSLQYGKSMLNIAQTTLQLYEMSTASSSGLCSLRLWLANLNVFH